MKNLIEISKIVTKRKVKKIEIFDEYYLKHKNSKFNEFYAALSANKFKNDRDAATYLYQSTPTDPKYRQLKSRFKKRLLNNLFFLDVNVPSAANYERASYSCNRDWTLVQILLSYGATQTAVSHAKQILTTALKFKFANIIVNCARILRANASENGDEKAFLLYHEHVTKYSKVLDAEVQSEELFQRVKLSYFKPPYDLEQIEANCESLVRLSETFDSPIIFYNMFLVWILRYEMVHEYEIMLEICDQADMYIEKNPDFYHEEKLIIFHTKRMLAYLHLKDYKKGKVNAERCLNAYPEGSSTWFSFMEYYLLLAIHTEQYIQAMAIYNQATSNSKFKKLDSVHKEKWALYEAFLNYIINYIQQDNLILQRQQKKRFNNQKFLDKSPNYGKDLRIFNVLIYILQVLFLLEKRNYTGASEKIDRLKNLANRQLKKDEYYRPIQFIRLLQALKKANYQTDEMRTTEKYRKNLESQNFAYRGALYQLEVIPYEKLWDFLLARLTK